MTEDNCLLSPLHAGMWGMVGMHATQCTMPLGLNHWTFLQSSSLVLFNRTKFPLENGYSFYQFTKLELVVQKIKKKDIAYVDAMLHYVKDTSISL